MSEEAAPPSRTFSLRDLFVAFIVVAILLGFLLMIQNARNAAWASAQRGQCGQNMMHLSFALLSHVETYKTMPSLFWDRNGSANSPLSPLDVKLAYSWQVRILPFIEETDLYRSLSGTTGKFIYPQSAKVPAPSGNGTTTPDKIRIASFLCPALTETQPDGNCNYLALSATRLPLLLETTIGSNGQTAFKKEPDGMIIPDAKGRGQPMSRMIDGVSKTALLIESREIQRSNWYNPQQSFVVGFLPADTAPVDAEKTDFYPRFNPDWQYNPATGDRTALNFGPTNSQPMNAYHGIQSDPLERTWGPASVHEMQMIVVSMADGSRRYIMEDIDPKIFFSLITVQGNEPYDVP